MNQTILETICLLGAKSTVLEHTPSPYLPSRRSTTAVVVAVGRTEVVAEVVVGIAPVALVPDLEVAIADSVPVPGHSNSSLDYTSHYRYPFVEVVSFASPKTD